MKISLTFHNVLPHIKILQPSVSCQNISGIRNQYGRRPALFLASPPHVAWVRLSRSSAVESFPIFQTEEWSRRRSRGKPRDVGSLRTQWDQEYFFSQQHFASDTQGSSFYEYGGGREGWRDRGMG